ncbi:MAG: hypothetical protein Q7S58_01020 [Candidatus Binatus sp.]|uniref:LptM family lipoprotein n=1 Tax=Candidatus Binatus sp. TaxID=2811406 RepID=UPI00271F8563|nr:hypothetical protein [Candidatus Binatus sp.]MDO8430969.1 hypothetical protein [Candidatus Binatus sp.]
MNRAFLSFAVGAICVVLAGCGVQGEAYQPRPVPVSKSMIYLYRPYVFYASAITPVVTCGQESIELEAGGFYSYINDAGPVTCSATTEASTPLKFDAHPGEEYYVKEEVSPGNLSGRTQFTLMNSGAGRQEIASCRKQGLPDSGSHH